MPTALDSVRGVCVDVCVGGAPVEDAEGADVRYRSLRHGDRTLGLASRQRSASCSLLGLNFEGSWGICIPLKCSKSPDELYAESIRMNSLPCPWEKFKWSKHFSPSNSVIINKNYVLGLT